MNRLTSKSRKLIYGVGILILVIPIIWLGMPGTGGADEGGALAKLRSRYDLGERDLGKIDPTSATMNLVLLGFRGIATDLIWIDESHNEEIKDWAGVRANLDAIAALEPHYVRVWQYQGWNLSYNVAAAWDLVADRYYWVKEGAKYLKYGCTINDKIAQLPYEEARIVGTKIGRADEWKFFRKFFKFKDPNEDLYKGRPDPDLNPEGKDNYLAAKDLYIEANDLQEKFPQTVSMLIPLFRSYPYRSQLSYADALQREGIFDEVSQTAWEQANREWVGKYGQEKFLNPQGLPYHLEMSPRDIEEEAKNLDADLGEYRRWVGQIQNETRYPYWKTRSQVESAKLMIDAHRNIYEGEKEFRKGNLSGANDLLFKGLTQYQQLLQKYPDLIGSDDDAIEEGLLAVLYWQKILKLQVQPIPEKFPLSEMWAKHANQIPTIESRFKRETGSQE